MLKEVEHLKRAYYENSSSLEDLRYQFDEMKIGFNMDYEERKKASKYEKVLFYNYKGEAKMIAIFVKDDLLEQKIEIIRGVLKEYYEFQFFYDEVIGLLLVDMVRLELAKHKLPYISIIDLLHDTRKVSTTINIETVKGENFL